MAYRYNSLKSLGFLIKININPPNASERLRTFSNLFSAILVAATYPTKYPFEWEAPSSLARFIRLISAT